MSLANRLILKQKLAYSKHILKLILCQNHCISIEIQQKKKNINL